MNQRLIHDSSMLHEIKNYTYIGFALDAEPAVGKK